MNSQAAGLLLFGLGKFNHHPGIIYVFNWILKIWRGGLLVFWKMVCMCPVLCSSPLRLHQAIRASDRFSLGSI
jgi:hypothetical protein